MIQLCEKSFMFHVCLSDIVFVPSELFKYHEKMKVDLKRSSHSSVNLWLPYWLVLHVYYIETHTRWQKHIILPRF